ncbi:MAG TPA: hypothetical protein VFL81_01770 [Candidatus Saccharimonadales bacterium]|nr:hypothetical protein [Candidatus Saccharimonadales bacterium]
MNENDSELNEIEMSGLFRLVGSWLVVHTAAQIEDIDIRGVNQRPGDVPREFVLKLSPEQYATAFNVDDLVETVIECEMSFVQDHLIDEFPYDQPLPAHVRLDIKSRTDMLGETIIKREWFVISDPKSPESDAASLDSYVGIEYSRPSGERLLLGDWSPMQPETEALYQDLKRSRRTINQTDAMHFRRLLEILDA